MFLTSDPSDPFSNFDPACVAQSLSDRYEFDLNATDASRCAYLVEVSPFYALSIFYTCVLVF